METKVVNLDNAQVGSIQLADEVFGVADIRADIIQRMVVYQLAKRQAGTHKSKTYGEVAGSTRKIYKQKGTGNARHGAIRAPQFRGGGKAFGPVVRSHAIDLPKKVRAMALRHALSAKVAAGKLIVVEDLKLDAAKTKTAVEKFGKRYGSSPRKLADCCVLEPSAKSSVRSVTERS